MKTLAANEHRPGPFAAIACWWLCWAFCGAIQAQDAPILDYAEQKMLDVGAQLQNAKMRLDKDFAGVGAGAGGQQMTPVVSCCRTNLETIDGKLKDLRAAMERMVEFYRGRHDASAVTILVQMDARLDQITQGMIYFARAPTTAEAFDARNGLIRPWNEFRNGIRALRDCCPIPIPVAADGDEQSDEKQPDKKDKKDKKKSKKDGKKQGAEGS